MLTIALSIICIILLLTLFFIYVKIRPLYKDLRQFKQKHSLLNAENDHMGFQIDEKLSSGLKSVSDKSDQLKNDPLVSELTDTLQSRVKFFSKMFLKVLESSQIILGISAGLFGMSVVAVIFHFMKYVGNHQTSELLESVSYSVFFLFVALGIFSNNYLQRKIKREQKKLLKAEGSFEERLGNLKAEYEAILDKSQKEQHKKILAKVKIIDELSQLDNQRQQEILESSTKTDTIFKKTTRRFIRKRKPSAESENE
jgi:hypothetical protein